MELPINITGLLLINAFIPIHKGWMRTPSSQTARSSSDDMPLTEDDYTLLMQAINLLGNDAGNLEDIKQILVQVRDRLEALLNHGN